MQDEDKAWLDWQERISKSYDEANYGSSLHGYCMRSSHALLEGPYGKKVKFDQVLEIGAGSGQHLPFVRHKFSRYILADHNPRLLDVAERKLKPSYGNSICFNLQEGNKLEFADNCFDRVIATHVLEHIYMPHLALKEWRRVTKNGGTISILIPTDPGFAWRLGKSLGPRKNAIKLGLAYDYIMAREHVNSCSNLIALLRHYFPSAREAWWPFPFPSVDANLFYAFNARVTKDE